MRGIEGFAGCPEMNAAWGDAKQARELFPRQTAAAAQLDDGPLGVAVAGIATDRYWSAVRQRVRGSTGLGWRCWSCPEGRDRRQFEAACRGFVEERHRPMFPTMQPGSERHQ